jgi:hypothetical protein
VLPLTLVTSGVILLRAGPSSLFCALRGVVTRPLKGKRSVPLLVLVPHATLAFLASSQAAGSAAAAAGAFFCTAWVGANLVCEVGKKATGRQRPCVAMRKELDLVYRRLPQIQV